MRGRLIVRWTLAGALFAAAVYVSATELIEAYGAGPPFYDRTTNMDKWSSPWPLVIGFDVVAALLIWFLLRTRRPTQDRRPGDR